MCLHIKATKSGRKPKPKIAKEDIVVYKRIKRRTNRSLHRDFPYQPGKRYRVAKMELVRSEHDTYIGLTGFHSFKEITGFSSIRPCPPQNAPLGSKLVVFIIPKGTRYYEGTTNGYEDSPGYISQAIRAGDLNAVRKIKGTK